MARCSGTDMHRSPGGEANAFIAAEVIGCMPRDAEYGRRDAPYPQNTARVFVCTIAVGRSSEQREHGVQLRLGVVKVRAEAQVVAPFAVVAE